MARIFLSLSLFAISLLVVNVIVGLNTGDLNGAAKRFSDAERAWRLRRESGAEAELDELKAEHDAALSDFQPYRKHASLHIMLGLGAALVSVLVNSITVTYFVGTSRWCREVCDTYYLGEELAIRSTLLKRKTFPWSGLGILATMAIVALGAASDPSALGPDRASQWVSAHFIAAIVGITVIAYALLRQVAAVGANYEIINEILAEVNEIRAAKGLDSSSSEQKDSSSSDQEN